MKDLTQIYAKSGSTMTFNNFFKTLAYKDAKEVLDAAGLKHTEIILRTPPAPNRPAQVLAHDLIAFAFIQWLDGLRYQRMVLKLLNERDAAQTQAQPQPQPAGVQP
jgi:hypothetical protein